MSALHRCLRRHGFVTGRAAASAVPARPDRATLLWSTLLLGACLVAVASAAHAGLYKWKDERGVVHYSDKMPPDAVNRASYELNRQGVTVRKTEQARPVPQRIAATEDDGQRARQAERERQLAARRDRAIVESYSSENEIELAKTRAVATIDGQVQSAEAFIAQMQKRREELESKRSTYAPRPVPGAIQYEIETINAEITRQEEFIAAKKKESASVAARYDADKQRFRELRSAEASAPVVTTEDGRTSAAGPATLQLTRGTPGTR